MRSRALNDLRVARIRLTKPVRENLPAVVLEAMSACVLIVEEREKFPELGSGKGQPRNLFGERERERHLLRLEAIAKVLMCIISHMDLVTLRAGRRRPDGSCDAIRTHAPRRRADGRMPSVPSIEMETGLRYHRVTRALSDLRDAGYITTHFPARDYRDEQTGETRYRGFPAVQTVTKTCLARLGVDLVWLEEERRKAVERQEKGPEPLIDIRVVRERRRIIRAQALAAKRAQLGGRQPPGRRSPPRRLE